MKFPSRRFICNFVDGTAEFNYDAIPPAQEYVSLVEFEAQLQTKDAEIKKLAERLDFWGDAYQKENWKLIVTQDALFESQARESEWEKLAKQWMADYDKLKEKYEPLVLVPALASTSPAQGEEPPRHPRECGRFNDVYYCAPGCPIGNGFPLSERAKHEPYASPAQGDEKIEAVRLAQHALTYPTYSHEALDALDKAFGKVGK